MVILSYAALVSAAASAGFTSGSPHIRNAGIVVALVYVSSIAFWFVGKGVWRYVTLDIFALLYFYSKWAAPKAQHRTFHFLLMAAYLFSTSLFAFQLAAKTVLRDAALMSPGWYQLIANVVFAAALLLIVIYGLLRRRAARDPKKWRDNVDQWFPDKK